MDQPSEPEIVVNHCPECGQSLDVTAFPPFAKIICPHCESAVRVRTTLGHYRITSMLGEGGMSQVFKAEDLNLGREVALKILHQNLSEDKSLMAMFEREAKLTASIHHPNVVKVYSVGRDQGYFFIAMELVDATSLELLIANQGAHSEETVMNIAHDVTSGLRAAHHAGLIHRDIKPGNMLVTGSETTKLVDFGLAVHQDTGDESEDLWATPFYVPPEKLDGAPDTFLGDIYSLGATLYHALAGKPPFEANTSSMDELRAIKASPISLRDDNPLASKAVVKFVDRLMSYNPEERAESYDALLEEIEEIQEKEHGTVRKGKRRVRGNSGKLFAGGGIAAILAAAAIWFFVFSGDKGDDALHGVGTDGERVIGAGENANIQRYLDARALLAEGKFSQAETIFSEIDAGETLSDTAKAWTAMNRGICALFLGKLEDAEGHFARLAQMPDYSGEDEETSKQQKFLRKLGKLLKDPLPLMPEEQERYRSNSYEALGLLTGGLKNWNQGQFASAMDWLEKFSNSTPPDEFFWVSAMIKLIGVYQSDFEVLKSLPKPSVKDSPAELNQQKARLSDRLSNIKTRGGMPRMIKNRIARVDELLELKKERAAMAATNKVGPGNGESVSGKGKSNGESGPSSPGDGADREKLSVLLDSLEETYRDLQFTDGMRQVEALSLTSGPGEQWKKDALTMASEAAKFPSSLTVALKVREYEGVVKRREGVPLEAKVNAKDASTLLIDLGFGPNEVAMEAFDPAWLVEVAEKVYPELSSGNAPAWQQVAWFSLACGFESSADRIAGPILSIDSEFAETWNRLRELR